MTEPARVRTRPVSRFVTAALEPIDAASLVVYRIAFGALLGVAVIRFFAYGWITEFYVAPTYYFSYPGFGWVQPWPGWGMYAHFGALGVLAVLVALGIWYRFAIAAVFVLFTYVELLDQTNYLNHYYLISIVAGLMMFMPLGRGCATVPRWCLWALRAQVGLVYVFAGIAKLRPDWLLEAQPLTIWLAMRSDLPLVGGLLTEPWVAYAASWLGAAFDLSIPFLLLWRRTRAAAFAAVIAFHVTTFYLFHLGLFPWLMIANATLLFAPSWPRRLFGRVRPRVAPTPAATTWRRLGLACLAVHFALQVAVPFRYLLYPGNVLWTEQGMRFGWRVMLAEKAGMVRFHVTEPHTGRTWLVYPGEQLSPRQEKMMSFQPDMIRQFARHLAAQYGARGYRDVEVRAEAYVSLNGRRSTALIDPAVNLARERFSWAPYAWILSPGSNRGATAGPAYMSAALSRGAVDDAPDMEGPSGSLPVSASASGSASEPASGQTPRSASISASSSTSISPAGSASASP